MKQSGFVTTKQAASILGISTRRIRMLVEKGQLEAVKVGRDWLIEVTPVRRRLEADRQVGRPRKAIA